MIAYAAPVWSLTSPTNYRHLQVYQSKCFRVIGDFPPAHSYIKPPRSPSDNPNLPIRPPFERQILRELPLAPETPHS
jgi:hypothetical protein